MEFLSIAAAAAAPPSGDCIKVVLLWNEASPKFEEEQVLESQNEL